MALTINNQTYGFKVGDSILKVCGRENIYIPTICHDERLTPHGACRLCVVEVEQSKSLVAACTTPVHDGMTIHTHSDRVVKARKDILELMWSTHRNDCLTCSDNGKCQLQELCYIHDIEPEHHYYKKRLSHNIDVSNKFYRIDSDKCILCGKCVRVCHELQGTGAIGFAKRGYHTHITHPFEMGMEHSNCVSCGNCINVCPTGAISEKTKIKARPWQAEQVQTTCGYCGVGCQINLNVKDNQVVGIEPVQGELNNGLLCVKGKFAYQFINHHDRLTQPLVRRNGVLEKATWDEAYNVIVTKINEIKTLYGPDAIAGMSSARCTTEDNYVMQKFFRASIGTNSVDHCARL
jgi:formate dehydrogenase major subunit